MPSAKIAITVEQSLLYEIDAMVRERVFENRSQAIQSSLRESIAKRRKTRLYLECAKLEPLEEQAFAQEGMKADAELWEPY